jgi:hypothetical protein
LISKRVFRGTPTEAIFSYLPRILEEIGVKVASQRQESANDLFKVQVEGVKLERPSILIRITIEGGKESWFEVAGNFLPHIYTSKVTAESYEVTNEGRVDTDESIELLQQFDTKIGMYVWHTAG